MAKPENWWDLRTWDPANILGHVEEMPGAVAWLGEQLASLNKQVNDLQVTIQELEAHAFLAAKQLSVTKTRPMKGGSKEVAYNPSDDVAKMIARTDDEVLSYKRALNSVLEKRDKVQGYLKAMDIKQVLLAPVVGIHRDELRSNSGNTR